MPKWVSVVVVIIVFFTVAALYERWRVKGMDTWRRKHGFTPIHPFVPTKNPSVTMLVSHYTGRDGINGRYASAMAGMAGDTKVTIVSFNYLPSSSGSSKWFTIITWPANAVPQPMMLAPRGNAVLDRVVQMVKDTEGTVVADRAAQQAWVTEKRRRALDSWEHGGKFVLVDRCAGWVTEGVLTPPLADQLIAKVAEARRVME